MNDRFGINLKNNESNFSPINDPANNVYGVEKIHYTDILAKNKKKYPNLQGNNFTHKYVPSFLKKLNNGYNIINHRVNPIDYDAPVQNNYLSKLAEFNLSIQRKEKNWILSKLNTNHRLNDGIYDYLKEHNYV